MNVNEEGNTESFDSNTHKQRLKVRTVLANLDARSLLSTDLFTPSLLSELNSCYLPPSPWWNHVCTG